MAAEAAARARADAIAAGALAQEAAAAAKEAQEIATEKQRAEEATTRQIDAERQADGELTSADEEALRAQGGQQMVDEYRKALADANKGLGQWLAENGAEILITLLGIDNIVKCVSDGDLGACLWSLVDVGSFFLAVGKLPAVGKAIVKVIDGLANFFALKEKGRRFLEGVKGILTNARKERTPEIEACEWEAPAEFSGFAAAGKKRKCQPFGHVEQAHSDTQTKGIHIKMADNRTEIEIHANAEGKLTGKPISANGKFADKNEIDEAIRHLESSPKDREKMIRGCEHALGGGMKIGDTMRDRLTHLLESLKKMRP
ncbi:hypothetical protein [Crossiella sp. NPDC003009]